jgi:hypothetical protein
MHQVQLADEVYERAQRQAAKAGFDNVEDYLAELVTQGSAQDNEDNFDHIFTPEVIAELHQIAAEIDAGGKTYSDEEVAAHFDKKREEWLRNHPG